jgi:hypothetical protein
MPYRKVVHSNDWYGCFTAPFVSGLFAFSLLMLGAAWMGDSLVSKVFMTVIAAVFGACFLGTWYGLLFPGEREIVVEDGIMRWGNPRRTDRQRQIVMSEIARICYRSGFDKDRTVAILKDGKHVELPRDIIRGWTGEDEFVVAVKKDHPNILFTKD